MLAVWPLSHQFQTYTWPGPFGWMARNTPGNIAAGFAQGAIALVVGSLLYPPTRRAIHRFIDAKLSPIHAHFEKIHAHHKWTAEVTARTHLAVTGEHAPPHPHHGQLTGPPSAGHPPIPPAA